MPTAGCEVGAECSYVFLDAQLLELDKLGASGLQVESPSRLVGDALLAGTHDEGHEGGGLDLWITSTSEELPMCISMELRKKRKTANIPAGTSLRHTGHMCKWRRPSWA